MSPASDLLAETGAAAAHSLKVFLPSSFSLALASEKSDSAWASQWQPISRRVPPNGGWDWPKCRLAGSSDPTRLCLAMWNKSESELCGFLAVRLNNTACCIEGVEGCPNPIHGMRGLVLLVAIEFASMYAQANGRREVWICKPANDMLLWHLLNDYCFELAAPDTGAAFCRREV